MEERAAGVSWRGEIARDGAGARDREDREQVDGKAERRLAEEDVECSEAIEPVLDAHLRRTRLVNSAMGADTRVRFAHLTRALTGRRCVS